MPEANVTVTATFVVKTTAPSASYKDLEQGQWYQDSVDYVIENKIMEGNANEFNPYGDITRAEMVTILYNMEGKPEVTAESTYPDVANDIWYKAAVMWAADAKVADGYGDGTFGPTDTITREQVAVMLYRYAAFKGQDVSARASLESFADGSEVDSWAQDAMEWAVAAGLINGKDGNMLAPTAEITRVEVAAIIARYCQAK
jgi:hypothetical protein